MIALQPVVQIDLKTLSVVGTALHIWRATAPEESADVLVKCASASLATAPSNFPPGLPTVMNCSMALSAALKDYTPVSCRGPDPYL